MQTNRNSTRRSLLVSATALILSIAMLVGTTFAWFTDSASTKGNKIQAGTLDVQLLMYNGTDYVDISNDQGAIFGTGSIAQNNNAQTLWEPGKTQVAYLAIKNNGNLALKYKVALDVTNVTNDLYKVMEYAITPDATNGNPVAPWTGGNSVVEGTQFVTNDVSLAAEATHYFALSVHMKDEADNTYQKGEVDFDLTVYAAQLSSEEDSFGKTYDENATYEIAVNPGAQTVDFTNYANETEFVLNNYTDLKAFADELNVKGKSFSGKTVKLGADIDLGNTEWTPIGQTGGNGTTTYFQGTFDGDNHTIKNLAISASAWDEGANYAAGLFGFIDAGGATIKNLTIDGAKVEGHHWTGAVVGYLTGTVENCHVKNATIISTHANDDACGDKAGAVVGYINTTGSVVSSCTAYKCTIKAGRDAGQIVGCNTVGASVTECSVDEVTVEATGDCTGANIKNEIVGRT
ncbi:MAG: SipW-dependent-type signal peptide-containing protein [Gemmiger formicilis]|uniref:SipW-dependent-type signal peptide-containing protein n=1 Tax=Gemmiger formicilis TaxID=745368 RepID=UPI003FEF0CE6|nr:SipW-dependent-type signal peptide-containing protein [Gemmiger formicilis]